MSDRRRGMSLVELIVTLGVSSVAMAGVATFFSQQAHAMRGHSYRLELQQALRGSIDAITRDVRLAGACLPTNGNYVALTGTDAVDGDSITVRTGLVRANLSCVSGTTTAQVNAGGTSYTVDDASDFEVGKLAYVRDPNGGGEFFKVTAVAANQITMDAGAGQIYPVNSTVYAVDQRRYSLDKTVDPPLLILQIDEQDPQPFAAGITRLDFEYVLRSNCPDCDVIDLSTPPTTATWWQVNEVVVTMTAESVGAVLPGDEGTLTQVGRAKPRNLL